MNKTKLCPKCKNVKNVDEYYKRANSQRIRSTCKECLCNSAKEKRSSLREGKRKHAWYYINQNVINNNDLNTWYYAGLLAADGSINKKKK